MNKTRVLILGGGFGGLYAALEFEKRRDPDFEVTLAGRTINTFSAELQSAPFPISRETFER